MLENVQIKEKLIKFSIFFGIVLGMFIILISLCIASRSSWQKTLAEEMQSVFNEYESGVYTVNKFIKTKSLISTSSAVYSVIKKGQKQNESYYGVIVRIPTIAGPSPAVFLYNEKFGVSFAGYAVDPAKAVNVVSARNSTAIIRHWEKQIPQIISRTLKS